MQQWRLTASSIDDCSLGMSMRRRVGGHSRWPFVEGNMLKEVIHLHIRGAGFLGHGEVIVAFVELLLLARSHCDDRKCGCNRCWLTKLEFALHGGVCVH